MPKPCGLGTEQLVLPRVHYPPGIPDEAVARKPGMAVLSKGSLLLAGHFLPVAEQSKANAGAELSPAVTLSTTGTALLPCPGGLRARGVPGVLLGQEGLKAPLLLSADSCVGRV